MKIAQINTVKFGSTGKIMLQIADCVRKNGGEAITYSTNLGAKKYKKLPPAPFGHKYYGSYFENTIHLCLSRLFGFNGCYSWFSTLRLVCDLK